MAHPPDRTSRTPLWVQVRDDITRRIDDGEFVDDFPGEHALREHYDVSRQTVRTALRSLRESGVLIAGRGVQSRVRGPRIEQPLGTLYSLFASVERAGMTQRSIVSTLDRRTDGAAARELGLPESAELVYLERVRLADDVPLALDRAWLPFELTAALLDADFGRTALYAELEARCGITPRGGSETIDAVTLDPVEAAELDSVPGAPAFAVQRRACAGEHPIEWRESVVRADRFRINARFSPAKGYRLSVDALAIAANSHSAATKAP